MVCFKFCQLLIQLFFFSKIRHLAIRGLRPWLVWLVRKSGTGHGIENIRHMTINSHALNSSTAFRATSYSPPMHILKHGFSLGRSVCRMMTMIFLLLIKVSFFALNPFDRWVSLATGTQPHVLRYPPFPPRDIFRRYAAYTCSSVYQLYTVLTLMSFNSRHQSNVPRTLVQLDIYFTSNRYCVVLKRKKNVL